jgi:hypothetical protein
MSFLGKYPAINERTSADSLSSLLVAEYVGCVRIIVKAKMWYWERQDMRNG